MENKNYLNCKKVDTAISRAKDNLTNEARNKGIYESFGQNEVRAIKEKFVDICDYSTEMNGIRSKINGFNEWCMNYVAR